MVPQSRYLVDPNGRLLVDRVFRFETMTSDLPPYLGEILGRPVVLPHANRSGVARHMRYGDIAEPERNVIRERYSEDFRLWGYPTHR